MTAGIDGEVSSRVRDLLEEGLATDTYTTAVAVAGTADELFVTEAVGRPAPESDRKSPLGTPFDVASLTKPIVTTTIFLRLLERGVVTMTDTLGDHVPALERTRRGDVPLHTLVTHTSGFKPYHFSTTWQDRADALADLYDRNLFDRRIGERYVYSCLNYVHLAAVLRQVTDSTIASLAEKHVFEPAGMETATIGPYASHDGAQASHDGAHSSTHLASAVPVTYDHEYDRGVIQNEIHDPIANVMDGESGNAGLFASAIDVSTFAQAILADAAGAGRLLSPSTVASLFVRRSGTDDAAQGYGWRVGTELIPAPQWSDSSIGHTGFTGTSLWIDSERERFACLLTNAVYTDSQLYRFRQRYHALVSTLETDSD